MKIFTIKPKIMNEYINRYPLDKQVYYHPALWKSSEDFLQAVENKKSIIENIIIDTHPRFNYKSMDADEAIWMVQKLNETIITPIVYLPQSISIDKIGFWRKTENFFVALPVYDNFFEKTCNLTHNYNIDLIVWKSKHFRNIFDDLDKLWRKDVQTLPIIFDGLKDQPYRFSQYIAQNKNIQLVVDDASFSLGLANTIMFKSKDLIALDATNLLKSANLNDLQESIYFSQYNSYVVYCLLNKLFPSSFMEFISEKEEKL
jgi:hypothetical protein